MTEEITKCSVCGSPVMYGSRHHKCGSTIMELVSDIKEKVLQIPTRAEPLDGQNYKYVRLEEVLCILQEAV